MTQQQCETVKLLLRNAETSEVIKGLIEEPISNPTPCDHPSPKVGLKLRPNHRPRCRVSLPTCLYYHVVGPTCLTNISHFEHFNRKTSSQSMVLGDILNGKAVTGDEGGGSSCQSPAAADDVPPPRPPLIVPAPDDKEQFSR